MLGDRTPCLPRAVITQRDLIRVLLIITHKCYDITTLHSALDTVFKRGIHGSIEQKAGNDMIQLEQGMCIYYVDVVLNTLIN